MLKIAITGGIASGKSTVGKLFAKKGITIIDSDDITRKLVDHNLNIRKKLNQHFDNILDSKRLLNRKKLANIIFSHKQERQWLNNYLHPLIFKELFSQMNNAKSPYVIALIPLLYETNCATKFDRVLTISCNNQTQIHRLLERNNLTTNQAQKKIEAQCTDRQRESIANDIITNNLNTSINELNKQILKLHNKYMQILLKKIF